MKSLLEKTREINSLIQKSAGHPISFDEMSAVLSENIDANIYIIGRRGKILGYSFMKNYNCPTMAEIVHYASHFPATYNEDLLRQKNPRANLHRHELCVFKTDHECYLPNKVSSIVPITGGGERLGTLVLTKIGEFDDGDMVLAEYGATLVGMEILRAKSERIEEIARQKAAVSIAFGTLSYSELEAVEHIFKELHETQGLLVASKIADKVGITRSVIVNALRKLESAGVVEVRSLGMKGTFIKILNEYLVDELEKLNKDK